MKYILYSTGCPKCEALKEKLNSHGIDFEVCGDMDALRNKYPSVQTVPQLEIVYDGTNVSALMDFKNAWSYLSSTKFPVSGN